MHINPCPKLREPQLVAPRIRAYRERVIRAMDKAQLAILSIIILLLLLLMLGMDNGWSMFSFSGLDKIGLYGMLRPGSNSEPGLWNGLDHDFPSFPYTT